MNKKAQAGLNVNLLWGLIILAAVIVVSGIFMAFGAQVTSDIGRDISKSEAVDSCGLNNTGGTANPIYINCSTAYNITVESLEAQETLAEKQNTVALIGVITIIIGLLLGVIGGVMYYMRG